MIFLESHMINQTQTSTYKKFKRLAKSAERDSLKREAVDN